VDVLDRLRAERSLSCWSGASILCSEIVDARASLECETRVPDSRLRREAIHSGGERTATTTARDGGGKHSQTLDNKPAGVKHWA